MGIFWHDSFISYQFLALLLFKGVTLQKFYQMHWLSFNLIHPCEYTEPEQLIPVWQHIIITQWWHMDYQQHIINAKWPKYWLGFKAPWILLLLNTEYFNICHKNCAGSLLRFLFKENKPKNADLDFFKHHQTNTSSPEKRLKEHLAHKIDLQLMLLLKRKRVFPKTHFSRKKLQRLTLWEPERTDWHYSIITHL